MRTVDERPGVSLNEGRDYRNEEHLTAKPCCSVHNIRNAVHRTAWFGHEAFKGNSGKDQNGLVVSGLYTYMEDWRTVWYLNREHRRNHHMDWRITITSE